MASDRLLIARDHMEDNFMDDDASEEACSAAALRVIALALVELLDAVEDFRGAASNSPLR